MTGGDAVNRWLIDVVCRSAAHGGRELLLQRITWDSNDEWLMDALSERVASGALSSESAEALARNERFATWPFRRKPSGGVTKFDDAHIEFLASQGVADRAGALSGWRFKCRCGVDCPVRQDKMERWLDEQKRRHPHRAKFRFDVSSYA